MATKGGSTRDRTVRGGVKMRRVDVLLKAETCAALDAARKEDGRSLSSMVSDAVDRYVEEERMGLGWITDKDLRKLVKGYVDECGCRLELTGGNTVKVSFGGVSKPVIVTTSHSGGRVIGNARADLEAAKREWQKARPAAVVAAPASDGWEVDDAAQAVARAETDIAAAESMLTTARSALADAKARHATLAQELRDLTAKAG